MIIRKISISLLVVIGLIGCGSKNDPTSANAHVNDANQTTQLNTQQGYVQEEYDYAMTLAVDLADTWIKTYKPQQNAWSWDAGVLMMGFMDLYEITGEQRFYQYAKDWIDFYLENGYFVTSSDTSIPGYTALRLYEKEGDPKYLEAGHHIWTYISELAGRTSEGGLNHLGLISGNQLWVDSLFMIGPFLMKYAEITGNQKPYAEYALQLSVFRKNLRDPDTGLYRHMYDDTEKTTTPEEPYFWGRGNGWVFIGYQVANNHLPEFIKGGLEFSPQQDSQHMLSTLQSVETKNGRFHTIVNAPETYLETSAGLLYAYGLYLQMEQQSIDAGLQTLAASWLQGAVQESTVDALGNTLLLGTSYGTSPGSLEYYNQVLKGENVAYGVGLYLLAATARERVVDKSQRVTWIEQPTTVPSEEYIQPPVPCEGVPCGKFHIARGNFTAAIEEFNKSSGSEALFFTAAIETVRLGFEAFYQIDRLAAKDIEGGDLIEWVNSYAFTQSQRISHLLQPVKNDLTFQSSLDRLLILESGGHTAIGGREFDVGEAYLFDALADVVTGVALITGADPSLTQVFKDKSTRLNQKLMTHPWKRDNNTLQGLLRIVAGMESLIAGLELIDIETDDQSDDLVPNHLLRLEGTFTIPGLLLETDVKEMLIGLGLSEQDLEEIDAPGDLIAFLKPIASTLKVVATLLELVI